MSKKSIIGASICLSLIAAPLLANTVLADSKQQIQNSQAAVEFFDDELNFTTTPLGVKMVVDGQVKNVTIIDVRSEKDFAEGHIPGAINIPFDKYHGFEGTGTNFPGLLRVVLFTGVYSDLFYVKQKAFSVYRDHHVV